MINHLPIIIVISPALGAFFVSLFGYFNKKFCYPIVVISTFISFITSVAISNQVINSGFISYHLGGWHPPYGIEYSIDKLSGFIALIVSFISFIISIYSKKSTEEELPHKITSFYTIFLLLISGLLGIVVTGDIFNLYVFLEIASLSGYALVASGKEKKALIASFNYLIVGTVAACFYLIGVGYIYAITGSLNMKDLSNLIPQVAEFNIVIIAFGFLMVGLSIKIAIFPLHFWLPNAYTYAPSVVSSLLSALMGKVGIYVIIRIITNVFPQSQFLHFQTIYLILGCCAVIFGALQAIFQTDFKRMLAYSSVSQIGYIVIGIALNNKFAFVGALLHILGDAFAKGSLFLVAGNIFYKTKKLNVMNFKNLHYNMPYTIASFVICALSTIGIPPFCGFFSKWYLLLGAIQEKEWIVAIFILAGSLLTAIYFFKVIENIFFTNTTSHTSKIKDVPLSMLLPVIIMSSGVVICGIFSHVIITKLLGFI